jgi:LPPG:FO 2-phospho-L-lactate transferase
MTRVVALAGGVGAAKLLRGIVRLVSNDDLLIVGNTGDDAEIYGLHVSPDLDIVMYTLAGIVDEDKGWGIANDSFQFLDMMRKLGQETWFKIGDRDLATHVVRTQMLKDGIYLSEITATLCEMLKVNAKLMPMSDERVRTKIVSSQLVLDFQEYFVKRGTKDEVTGVLYEGSENAKPAPEIAEALREAEQVVICPSNPVLSISPILSIPAIGNELRKTEAYVVGVSPIVGGKAIKGPAAQIMGSMGLEVSAYGVAKFYGDLLDHFVIDRVDEHFQKRIERLGMRVTVADTVMKSLEDSVRLAKAVLEAS